MPTEGRDLENVSIGVFLQRLGNIISPHRDEIRPFLRVSKFAVTYQAGLKGIFHRHHDSLSKRGWGKATKIFAALTRVTETVEISRYFALQLNVDPSKRYQVRNWRWRRYWMRCSLPTIRVVPSRKGRDVVVDGGGECVVTKRNQRSLPWRFEWWMEVGGAGRDRDQGSDVVTRCEDTKIPQLEDMVAHLIASVIEYGSCEPGPWRSVRNQFVSMRKYKDLTLERTSILGLV